MALKDVAAHYALRNPTATGAVAGTTLGAGLGYASGHPKLNERSYHVQHQVEMKARKAGAKPGSEKYEQIKKDHLKKMHRFTIGATAATYGAVGAMAGHNVRNTLKAQGIGAKDFAAGGRFHKKNPFNGRDFKAPRSAMHEHHQTLGMSGKEKTKAEVKKKYRTMARQHHPDMGGDENKFKKVNAAYEHVEKSPWFQKLASAFWDGFEKQAGSLSGARVDRFLNKMTKNHDMSMMKDVHRRVFANDSLKKNRLGTLKNRATEHAAETQAKGGFKGTQI